MAGRHAARRVLTPARVLVVLSVLAAVSLVVLLVDPLSGPSTTRPSGSTGDVTSTSTTTPHTSTTTTAAPPTTTTTTQSTTRAPVVTTSPGGVQPPPATAEPSEPVPSTSTKRTGKPTAPPGRPTTPPPKQ